MNKKISDKTSDILSIIDRGESISIIEKGILTSDKPKSALKLAFPATLAHRWIPGLFPPL